MKPTSGIRTLRRRSVYTAPCWWEGCQGKLFWSKLERLLKQKKGDNHHRPHCTLLGCHTWEDGPELNWGGGRTVLALRNDAAWERVKRKS